MRVEGKWCFGGSRDRLRTVTHNARGEVSIVTEDGTQDSGRLEGPWIFLTDDTITIKGDMDFRANRLNWFRVSSGPGVAGISQSLKNNSTTASRFVSSGNERKPFGFFMVFS